MQWQLNTAKFELNQGQRAFIYQQLSEFDPFLLSGSHISVEISPDETFGQPSKGVSITITLTHEGTQISATAAESDVITAATKAKEQLLEFLRNIQQEMLSRDSTAS